MLDKYHKSDNVKALVDAISKKGNEFAYELGLKVGICKPKQTEEETVTEIEETQDEVSGAVVKADETVEFVSTETPQVVESIVAPHTGFAAQASNFAPFIVAGVVLVVATIVAITVAKKRK